MLVAFVAYKRKFLLMFKGKVTMNSEKCEVLPEVFGGSIFTQNMASLYLTKKTNQQVDNIFTLVPQPV